MTGLGRRAGRTALLFLAAVLSFSSVSAQTPDSAKPTRANSLKPGAWALQFQITQDFTLNAFQGLLLSAKHHFSNKKAVRIGLGLNASVGESKDLFRNFQSDTLLSSNSGFRESNGQGIDVTLQYLNYPSPNKSANFFYGIGLGGGFSRSKSNSRSSNSTNSSLTLQWNTGFSGAAGVEWFATEKISLQAEYGFTLRYRWLEQTSKSYSTILRSEGKATQESINFDPSQVKFGLSVYF